MHHGSEQTDEAGDCESDDERLLGQSARVRLQDILFAGLGPVWVRSGACWRPCYPALFRGPTMILFPERMLARAALVAMAALAAVLRVFDPSETPWYPSCRLLQWTGFYCPGCGVTRMLGLLLHGYPTLAFEQNALAFVLLPVVLYLLARTAFNRRLPPRVHSAAVGACVVVALLFGVARNVVAQPWCRLAPGAACAVLR